MPQYLFVIKSPVLQETKENPGKCATASNVYKMLVLKCINNPGRVWLKQKEEFQ
jgi:hypothetical protein